jgi:glycosyltransferase involved in cell wall biosynthesis
MRSLIYISFDHFESVGGLATFMNNLKQYLTDRGYRYTDKLDGSSSIFFPISFDKNVLNNVKKNNGRIIQRLDGIYYPSKHGERYLELNSDIKDIYLNYSDFVIFQSEYSKKQCFAMLGEKTSDAYEIVLNGVNKDIFYPDRGGKKGNRLRLVTTGNFRNADMIEPVVKALDSLKGRLSFELIVVGPMINGELEGFLGRNYITKAGARHLNGVADILRGCDIFLYSHLNPPCPNSVIEAISCGLPVVGFDSGAMSELLSFGTDLLAPVSGDLFQQYKDFHHESLAEKIELCVERYGYFKERALDYSHLYSFDDCGRKYVEIFERLVN